ncbi:MAG: hypothetical protein AB7O97_06180 [Planctomycetota bacterium]
MRTPLLLLLTVPPALLAPNSPCCGQDPSAVGSTAPVVLVREGVSGSEEPLDLPLPELRPDRHYSVLATLADPGADGMVRVELFDPTGMPTGKVLHQGDPDMQFVYRPRIAGTSVLRVRRSPDQAPLPKSIDDATRAAPRDLSILALQQDDATLAGALEEGDGEARLEDGSAYSGRSALRVKSTAKLARNVPGWGFRIAEEPGPGEYRYLRFAVRISDGAGAMLALAHEGEFGGEAENGRRYGLGATPPGWEMHVVQAEAPRDWLVVTRDLWADAGAFTLTGMGLVPFGGTMWLDHVYLARTREALDAVTPATVRTAMARGSSDGLELLQAAPPPAVAPPFARYDDAVAWRVEIREITLPDDGERLLESEPNDQWNYASELVLGTAVHGGADDIEYLDNRNEGQVGWDWFRFEWNGVPKLVFFSLDCPDRDVVATMQVYVQNEVGRLVQYKRGKDPTEVRHDNQDASIAGWKFLSRVVADGTYWLRVKANHPNYVLRTTLHDVPPYVDPRDAVRTAAEYAALAGDSFFANVPRGGAVRTRVDTNTDETTRCFACHAGHYPLIGNLAAAKNGFRVTERPEFRNLVDRIYNVGAPFYGHDGATWARFDLAPTTGIARVGTMIADFEALVSGHPTDAIEGPARFAALVYGERDELPQKGDRTPDGNYEFDGNRPISDARVATEAWRLFDELARRTGDAEWRRLAAHMLDLMPTARLKDNEDLAEQMLGMLAMDRRRFAGDIARNAERLLAKVHDDGGWVTAEYVTNLQLTDLSEAAKLDHPRLPSLTFFTAQAAFALMQAGLPAGEAGREVVDRAVRLVLDRQLEFGGWMDPQGELFRTAYLETKWALILLSHRYPEVPSDEDSPAERPAPGFAARLRWLDSLWRPRSPAQLDAALQLLASDEPMLRTAAALAVQRMLWYHGDRALLERATAPLVRALADPCKRVAGAAALALRAIGNQGFGRDALLAAVAHDDARVRRWATRVFVHQFWDLARDPRCLDAMLLRLADPDFVVRLHAAKAVQQWWYRAEAPATKRRLLDALLERTRLEQRPEVAACLVKGLYNICDENTAELYGNDLRVMATPALRARAQDAREQVVERDLGVRLAAELRQGTRDSRLRVLSALGLRISRGAPNGNDTDDVVLFHAAGAAPLAQEILRALADEDDAIREQAAWAATAVRKHASPPLVAALLRATGDAAPAVRQAALRVLDVIEVHAQDLPAAGIEFRFVHLDEAASERTEDATRGLLRWLRRDPSSQRPEFAPELIRLARGAEDLEIRRLALQNLEWSAETAKLAAARDTVWSMLECDEPALRTEAEVQIERAHGAGGFLVQGDHRWRFVTSALQSNLAEQHERAVRFALWEEAGTPWTQLLPEFGKLLEARRPRLRADAVTLILRARDAGHDTAALLQQALLLPDADLRTRAAVALGIDPATVPAPEAAIERVDSPLDFDAFAAFVHPILMRHATTGARSCVECHNPHAEGVGEFVLVPAEDGAPSDEELIHNYNAAVSFVNATAPRTSPLLLKPLNPDRAIGALHGTSHGGGVSWGEPSDPDFKALLDWASGQKLDRAEQFHFDEFYRKVVPIFTDLGPTGDACWECHNTHNTLFMPEPANFETYTPQEARFLLDFVMRTVDLRTPEDSLVLQKPLHELDNPFREKDPNRPTHGGGIRWSEGKRSWQYRELLHWIERVAGKR